MPSNTTHTHTQGYVTLLSICRASPAHTRQRLAALFSCRLPIGRRGPREVIFKHLTDGGEFVWTPSSTQFVFWTFRCEGLRSDWTRPQQRRLLLGFYSELFTGSGSRTQISLRLSGLSSEALPTHSLSCPRADLRTREAPCAWLTAGSRQLLLLQKARCSL